MITWFKNLQRRKTRNIFSYNYVPQWTPRRYDALSREGYQKNVIVYRAVSVIARGLASVAWSVYEKEHRAYDHPLLTLLKAPNVRQAGSAFMESVISSLLLSGNAYIEIVGDDYPLELYNLRPDRMRIIPSAFGLPEAYEYEVDGKKFKITVDSDDLTKCPILHLRLFHPLDDWYGMSPIEAAGQSIDQHNAMSTHNISLLQNGARPSGCFIIKNSFGNLSEEQREALSTDIKEAYSGAANAGRMLLLEGDFEWKEMGQSLKDLDFIAGKNMSAREIAQAFGVPPTLVGIEGDATFSNYKEARFHLWEDTILPLLDSLVAEFNLWLAPRFSEFARIDYDSDSIAALAPRRESIWSRISEASFLTINEKRQALGYSPIPEGNILKEQI